MFWRLSYLLQPIPGLLKQILQILLWPDKVGISSQGSAQLLGLAMAKRRQIRLKNAEKVFPRSLYLCWLFRQLIFHLFFATWPCLFCGEAIFKASWRIAFVIWDLKWKISDDRLSWWEFTHVVNRIHPVSMAFTPCTLALQLPLLAQFNPPSLLCANLTVGAGQCRTRVHRGPAKKKGSCACLRNGTKGWPSVMQSVGPGWKIACQCLWSPLE